MISSLHSNFQACLGPSTQNQLGYEVVNGFSWPTLLMSWALIIVIFLFFSFWFFRKKKRTKLWLLSARRRWCKQIGIKITFPKDSLEFGSYLPLLAPLISCLPSEKLSNTCSLLLSSSQFLSTHLSNSFSIPSSHIYPIPLFPYRLDPFIVCIFFLLQKHKHLSIYKEANYI